ncbi:MAG: hypothetical protein JJ855_09115 [Rhodospirillales bacterium]|nr:hypothetical protein [Rhodospirillales bacterium]
MPTTLAAKPPVTDNMLFVDGISRSGKKLTCKIVSHLEGVDYFQYISLIENMSYLWHLGNIDLETAARLLKFNIDEFTYNRAIGRNLNTRRSDETSVYKAYDADAILARADAPDGAGAMAAYNDAGRKTLYHTHSVLAFVDVVFEAFPGMKFIHIDRHPIDIAEDWFRRGWGDRWAVDPLAFSVIADSEFGPVPWYSVGWAREYSEMTPAERCVAGIVHLQTGDRRRLDTLDADRRRQVHQFAFEHLIEDTHSVIGRLASFVGTEPHGKMAALLKAENCPSPIPADMRRNNLEKLKADSAPTVIDSLLEASDAYEKKWGLDPVA